MGLLDNHQMEMVVLYYTILALVEIPFIELGGSAWLEIACFSLSCKKCPRWSSWVEVPCFLGGIPR